MDDKLDFMIRQMLNSEGKKISKPQNLYEKIKVNISKPERGYNLFLNFYAKKLIVAALLGVFIFIVSFAIFTGNANILIAKVKTIFTMDVVDNEFKLFEKTEDKDNKIQGSDIMMNIETTLSDEDLTKKCGFNVVFPESINGEGIMTKRIAIFLQEKYKGDNEDDFKKLVEEAIDNPETFNKLKPYKPLWHVMATYGFEILDGSLSISIQPDIPDKDGRDLTKIKNITYQEVKTPTINGFWCEHPVPIFETIVINKNGEEFYTGDNTKPPKEYKNTYNLNWKHEGLSFSIFQWGGTLDKDTAIRIAEDYMKKWLGN